MFHKICTSISFTLLFVLTSCVGGGGAAETPSGPEALSVSSIAPSAGALGGSTAVTITGTGFLSGATVAIGGVTCTSPNVVSSTSITCITDAHSAGAINVVVTNTDLQVGTLASGYTYRAAPTVSSIAPGAGALGGATSVTITGTGFLGGATVAIGGVTCTSPNVVSSTSITCTTGAHSAGATNVVVTNTDSQVGTFTNGYTYQAAPTVVSILPSAGALGGSTAVTITGTDFLSGATVAIGGVTCTSPNVVSSTSITCTTGAHAAGATNIVVTNTDSQTDTLASGYTYQAAPTVTSISPSSGLLAGNTSVTISGTGFVSGVTVSIGGGACTAPFVVSSTSVTCTTGAHAGGAVDVVVTNLDSQAGTLTDGYTYSGWLLTSTTGAPSERSRHTAVWSDSKMIVWGGVSGTGNLNSGGIYDPLNDTWTSMSTTGAPSARYGHTSVWTGSKMVVWGGTDGTSELNSGAIYDPSNDTWASMATTGAPSARYFHTVVWTGSKMIVWGGYGISTFAGAIYDPSNDTWTSMSIVGVPSARVEHTAVWTGSEMIVWGGNTGAADGSGAAYSLSNDTWTTTTVDGAPPSARRSHTAVWTGSKMVIWGGFVADDVSSLNTGSMYNLSTWTETDIFAAEVPSIRRYHTAVWTGSRMIIYGGYHFGSSLGFGGLLNPSNNTWANSSDINEPLVRSLHTAVWTGTSMIVWGGYYSGTSIHLDSGGIYYP